MPRLPRLPMHDAAPVLVNGAGHREVTVWVTPEAPTRLTVPGKEVPTFALCRLVKLGRDVFRLEPETLDLWIKKSKTNFCRSLGIDMSDDTLVRLARAGFVRARYPAPQIMFIHLQSLLDHLHATENKPAWWTRERRLKYLSACDDLQRVKKSKVKSEKGEEA